jgi:hypothetical protein
MDPLLPVWLLSPEYVAVTVSAPPGKTAVVQVAVPGFPEVTEVVPQPVFVLHVTDPLTSSARTPSECTPPFLIKPNCPEIVAVNVTDWPYTDGSVPEVTTVAAVASFTTCE